MTDSTVEKLRLDKWLWFARLFRSRSLAALHIARGGFRVNRVLVAKSHHTVQPGDIVTFSKGPYVRVVEVLALGARRGPVAEARALFEDLNPPELQPRPERPNGPAQREAGAGRPTKKHRRETDQLRGHT